MKTMRITVKPKRQSFRPHRGAEHPIVNESDDVKLYQEHDKVVLKETGEVLTVDQDPSDQVEPGIVVKEKVGRLLLHCEVRPAGRTRERREAGMGVTETDTAEEGQSISLKDTDIKLSSGDAILVESYQSKILEIELRKTAFITECDLAITEAMQRIADIRGGYITS